MDQLNVMLMVLNLKPTCQILQILDLKMRFFYFFVGENLRITLLHKIVERRMWESSTRTDAQNFYTILYFKV